MAIGSPLEATMANVFLSFYEMKLLGQCPDDFKPVFYRRCIDDVFVLFESAEITQNFMHIFIHFILICLLHLEKK